MEETVAEFMVEDLDLLNNTKDDLSVQDLKTLDISTLTPLTPNVISRQATINIGTIGHVAHGKSTIVKAISGVKTVKHSTELVRNITIKLGYANAKIYKCNKCPRPKCYKSYGSSKSDNPKCDNEGCEGTLQLQRHVSFVDCPGHDILMATMLTGAAVMDAALLLIAANETCPQPQTSEHLAAIELMKLKKVFILQNKIDLVRDSDATEHYKQILQFIQMTIADGSPIIPVSAQLGYNIDVLCENLVKNIPIPERFFLEPPRLIVIRSFDVNKPGTSIDKIKGGVAGGSITQGVLKIGDRIEVKPGVVTSDSAGHFQCSPIYSRIESLFAEANQLQYAVPGGLIGVGTNIDPTLCRADRLVGQVLGQEGTLPDVFVKIEISFFLLSRLLGIKEGDNKKIKVKKISRGEALMINVGSTSTGGTVSAVREDLAIISLARPVCSKVNEKIAISRRVDRHWRLIGWGSILCGTKVVSSTQNELSNNITFAEEEN